MSKKGSEIVPKFTYHQKVELINGFYRGSTGRCLSFCKPDKTYAIHVSLVTGAEADLYSVPEDHLEAI